MRDRYVDAVRRRAVNGIDVVSHALQPQRTSQRQRVSNRTGFLNRRNNRNLAERRQRFGKCKYSF